MFCPPVPALEDGSATLFFALVASTLQLISKFLMGGNGWHQWRIFSTCWTGACSVSLTVYCPGLWGHSLGQSLWSLRWASELMDSSWRIVERININKSNNPLSTAGCQTLACSCCSYKTTLHRSFLINRNVFLTALAFEKSKSKLPADLISSEDLVFRNGTLSRCSHMLEKVEG